MQVNKSQNLNEFQKLNEIQELELYQEIEDSDELESDEEIEDSETDLSNIEIVFTDSTDGSSNEDIESSCDDEKVSSTPNSSLWYKDFQIPWKSMPGKLLYVFYEGRRPSKTLMRTFVKILSDEIRKFDLYPSKKILDTIAREIFELLPQSLCDDPAMDVLEYTYQNFLTQLENRLLKYFDVVLKLTDIKNEINNSFNQLTCDNMDKGLHYVEFELKRNVSDKPLILNSKVNAAILSHTNGILNHSTVHSDTQSSFLPSEWYKEFYIPWYKLSSDLLKTFRERQCLDPIMRNDMVKVISNEIRTITKYPDKKSIRYIARKVYKAYPESLCDPVYVGERITKKDYALLVKELRKQIKILNKNENMKPKWSKYVNHHFCPNWRLKKLPKYETKKSQLQKKQDLKVISTDTLDDQIIQLLKDTFYSQRIDIIKSKNVETIIAEWPLLFTTIGLLNHFKSLVGFDCLKKFHDSLLTKAHFIFYYFMYLSRTSCKTLKALFEELENSEHLDKGECSTILMFSIMAYFQEGRENLFLTHKTPLSESDEEESITNLPETPCLIICGESPFHCSNFMLCIQGKVVNRKITDFTTGVILLFISYFIFNICYPVGAKATLEFTQMHLFDIYTHIPDRKVTSLIKALKQFQEQDKGK